MGRTPIARVIGPPIIESPVRDEERRLAALREAYAHERLTLAELENAIEDVLTGRAAAVAAADLTMPYRDWAAVLAAVRAGHG